MIGNHGNFFFREIDKRKSILSLLASSDVITNFFKWIFLDKIVVWCFTRFEMTYIKSRMDIINITGNTFGIVEEISEFLDDLRRKCNS